MRIEYLYNPSTRVLLTPILTYHLFVLNHDINNLRNYYGQ